MPSLGVRSPWVGNYSFYSTSGIRTSGDRTNGRSPVCNTVYIRDHDGVLIEPFCFSTGNLNNIEVR